MLKTNNLTIKFGGLTAVNEVNIEVRENTICGLIGPNGAGKTTLFNLVSGVYAPTSGTITFEEKDISGKKPFQVHQYGISRTYQAIQLFGNMTLAENVMVGMHDVLKSSLGSSILRLPAERREEKEAKERAIELLDFVGLKEKYNMKADSLPYGDQRKTEIVRALANDPKLVLLDEPAAGMNTKEKADLMETIKRIRDRGVTVLLVEHDMKLVMGITEDIFVLNYGKLIAHGTPVEIQNNEEVIKAYLGGN